MAVNAMLTFSTNKSMVLSMSWIAPEFVNGGALKNMKFHLFYIFLKHKMCLFSLRFPHTATFPTAFSAVLKAATYGDPVNHVKEIF